MRSQATPSFQGIRSKMNRKPSQWPIFRRFFGKSGEQAGPSAQHNIAFDLDTKPSYDPEKLSIRPAGITDVQFIMTLENASENRDYVDKWSFMVHSQNICSGEYSYFIVESHQDPRPLGFVILRAHEHDGIVVLQRMVIWAKAKGIGSYFLHKLLSRLENEPDYEKIILYMKETGSATDNALVEFWEQGGFQIDKDKQSQTAGHIMMSRDL